ncbi:MAG: hypothetical protein WBA74_22275 [Cyclobacteriaceae bacterium]
MFQIHPLQHNSLEALERLVRIYLKKCQPLNNSVREHLFFLAGEHCFPKEIVMEVIEDCSEEELVFLG